MEKVQVTDEEIIVDNMIMLSTGEKEKSALPSYGRNLVPYFCPSSSANPCKQALNIATDVDSYRRAGGEVQDIPQPRASRYIFGEVSERCGADLSQDLGRSFTKPLKMRKKGGGARGRVKVKAESVSSPTSPLDGASALTSSSSDSDATDSELHQKAGSVLVAQVPTWQQEELRSSLVKAQKKASKTDHVKSCTESRYDSTPTAKQSRAISKQLARSSKSSVAASSPSHIEKNTAPELRSPLPERFAGAAFHNSPAPSCLPIPSFVYQSGQDSPASVQETLSASPSRFPSPDQQEHVPFQPSLPVASFCTPNALMTPSPGAAAAVCGSSEQQTEMEHGIHKLHTMLRLGTPSPVQAPISNEAQSRAATASLRRMLQLG